MAINYSEVNARAMNLILSVKKHVSSIEPNLKALVELRVSQINGCAYCVDMHHKELKHLGETELRLSSLCVWEETPYFSDKEKSVLLFTDLLTRLERKPISEETYNNLLAFFSKEEICYLTLAIAQINTWTRLMKIFRFTPGNYTVK